MRPCSTCIHCKVCAIKRMDVVDPNNICQYYQYQSNARECLKKLKDEILGKDWYIVDPVDGNQGNEIITQEIISKHNGIPRFVRRLFGGW